MTMTPQIAPWAPLLLLSDPTPRAGQDQPRRGVDTSGRLEALQARIRDIASYPANWNGHGARRTNAQAIEAATRLLNIAEAVGPLPGSIGADVEGGVGFNWYGGGLMPGGARRRFASVSVDNDLNYVVLTHDRLTSTIEARDLTSEASALAEAISEAIRFCNG